MSPAARKPPATATQATKSRKTAAATKKPAATKRDSRADYGSSADGFFEKQPAHLRAILEELRSMVMEVAPEAVAKLRWGMPNYVIDGEPMCMLGAHKAHVNLVLFGPSDAFEDLTGLLAGEGKNGRHLKLMSMDELPRKAVKGWLRTAAKLARQQAGQ